MFKESQNLTREHKALILGFMAGARGQFLSLTIVYIVEHPFRYWTCVQILLQYCLNYAASLLYVTEYVKVIPVIHTLPLRNTRSQIFHALMFISSKLVLMRLVTSHHQQHVYTMHDGGQHPFLHIIFVYECTQKNFSSNTLENIGLLQKTHTPTVRWWQLS